MMAWKHEVSNDEVNHSVSHVLEFVKEQDTCLGFRDIDSADEFQ